MMMARFAARLGNIPLRAKEVIANPPSTVAPAVQSRFGAGTPACETRNPFGNRIRRHFCYPSAMNTERKEPTYLFTEKQVADKSEIARRFLDVRTRLNDNVDKADNFLVKRFYNLDHNAYLEGAVPAKYKELMGRQHRPACVATHCIDYHLIQSYRLGVTRAEQEEALNVALIVGGSIVIPHLRRAYELLSELYGCDCAPSLGIALYSSQIPGGATRNPPPSRL